MNFNKIHNDAIKLSKQEYKQLIKLKRTRSILPHPLIIKTVEDSIYKNKKNPNIKKLHITLVDISKLISADHSKHNLTGDLALSNIYLKKHFHSFNSHRYIIDEFLQETFKGNNIQNFGCSSFIFKNNPYIENEVLYIKKEKAEELITSFFEGKISFEEYYTAYELILNKKDKNPTSKKIEIINIFTEENEIDESKSVVEGISYVYLAPEVHAKINDLYNKSLDIIKTYDNDLEKLIEYKEAQNSVKYLKEIIKGTDKNIVYFKQAKSKVHRVYNIFNRMDKKTRNYIFSDYIEMDLKNAAPNIVLKLIEEKEIQKQEEFEYFNEFSEITKNRDNIIKDLQKIYNSRFPQNNETKPIFKKYLLSILFGSNLNVDFFLKIKKQNLSQTEINCLEVLNYWSEKGSLSYKKIINEVAKFLEVSKKELSHLFMKRETKIMKEIISTISAKEKEIIHIHDGILVPKSLYLCQTFSQAKKLNDILLSNSTQISNQIQIDDSKEEESNSIDEVKKDSEIRKNKLKYYIISFWFGLYFCSEAIFLESDKENIKKSPT